MKIVFHLLKWVNNTPARFDPLYNTRFFEDAMILKGKSILIISPESWTHLFVSKHHYAVHLAQRGNQVFFLNPPSNESSNIESDFHNLHTLNYTGFPVGMRLAPKFIRKTIQRKIFHRLEKLANTSFDIIWSFDNSVFYDFDALPSRVLKISHIVDLNMDFQSVLAANTSDVCFCTTQFIKHRLEQYAPGKVFWINHGVRVSKDDLPFTLNSSFPVNAGYYGNLDIKYLDWTMLIQEIDDNPEIGFHFAGKLTSHIVKDYFNNRSNMIWHGIIPSPQLPSFNAQMDVLFIAYKADEFKEQLANPHKILEYLISGKPVVATYTAQYASLDFIYMSHTNDDWPKLFNQVVSNLSEYTTSELIKKRQAFALDNTYDRQLDRIEEILSKLKK